MRRIAVQRHTAVVLLLTKHYMSSYHCCLRNPACMLDNLRQHRSLWGFSHYSETEEPSKASRKLDRSKQITCCARLLLLKTWWKDSRFFRLFVYVSLLRADIWKFMKSLWFIWTVILHNTTLETKSEQQKYDNSFKKKRFHLHSQWICLTSKKLIIAF